ncbi:MAG: TlpA family protein disulfide reductase [Selenomonas sp.]|uniref:TlpA family protein disulfide reductase n=1 Tax=uncultured Selenomonas sp. TaxID=159275 RepID=UPI0028E6985E|nr:TlpA disulfide reductase family protein [uncultured Selenomonas sp.]
MKTRRTMQGLIGALLALFLMTGCGLQAEESGKSAEAKAEQAVDAEGVDGTAPPFKATSFDGSEVAINAAMDKKLYVINFWATWCPPCRAEMPELNEFAKKHEGEVTFYAVNLQEPKDTVDKFLKDNGYTMPVLLDLKGEAADTYKVRAIPTTYVIDRDGKILLKKIGGTTAAELETALTRAAK